MVVKNESHAERSVMMVAYNHVLLIINNIYYYAYKNTQSYQCLR